MNSGLDSVESTTFENNLIFYFEDNLSAREKFGRTLKIAGYELEEHISAESALRSIDPKTSPQRKYPAFAIIDFIDDNYHEPMRAGPDIIAALRRRWPLLPIIVLSSLSDRSADLTACEEGADSFITKNTAEDTGYLLTKTKLYIEKHRQLDVLFNQSTTEDESDDEIMRDGFLEFHSHKKPTEFYWKGKSVKLTPTRRSMVEMLFYNRGKDVSYEEIRKFANMTILSEREADTRVENVIYEIDQEIKKITSGNTSGKQLKALDKLNKKRERYVEYSCNIERYVREKVRENVSQQIGNIRATFAAIDPDYSEHDPIVASYDSDKRGYRWVLSSEQKG